MAAKYTIVIKKGSQIQGVVALSEQAMQKLITDGLYVGDDSNMSASQYTTIPEPIPKANGAKAVKKEPIKRVVTKHGHSFTGRHLNQQRRLSRAGVTEIVFSDKKIPVLRRKHGVSSTFIKKLRARITGDHNEKMKTIRAITERPHG